MIPPLDPRKIVGESALSLGPSDAIEDVRCQFVFVDRGKFTQRGRPDLLAAFKQELQIEAQVAVAFQQDAQRRKVDQMLSLVVGRSAAVPAVAVSVENPRAAVVVPAIVLTTDNICVPVAKDCWKFLGLESGADQKQLAPPFQWG